MVLEKLSGRLKENIAMRNAKWKEVGKKLKEESLFSAVEYYSKETGKANRALIKVG